jgi:hypothetical protein
LRKQIRRNGLPADGLKKYDKCQKIVKIGCKLVVKTEIFLIASLSKKINAGYPTEFSQQASKGFKLNTKNLILKKRSVYSRLFKQKR